MTLLELNKDFNYFLIGILNKFRTGGRAQFRKSGSLEVALHAYDWMKSIPIKNGQVVTEFIKRKDV